jgi:flagellar capping protein FliD
MDDIVNPQTSATGALSGRITSEASLIQSYSQQIADIEQRVTLHESALRAQFTAMESAVAQLQSSSSALSSSSSSSG